ncbi:MAG: protease modulator HflK [Verrucomicrobia bacterium]|nr:protease modulator HflK [Verrucomicrobiota bacterium]
MSAEHDPHHPPAPAPPPPGMPEDSAGQALAETLRSSFFVIKILMVLLVAVFLCSGITIVGPQERAILLRFGKPVGEGEQAVLKPGFHWAFPAPIDEVVKIPAGQVRVATSTAGWYATTPELAAAKIEPPPGDSLKPGRDGYVLTSDANIIHAYATVRYRITDPVRFEFAFTNTPVFLTNALNNALFFAASQFTVDAILTRDVTAFREKVRHRLEQLIEEARLGIVIEQSDVQARAPRQESVSRAFDAVTEAGLKSGTVLNEAQSYANTMLSGALGGAAALTNAARTDKTRLVESIRGEADEFTAIRPQYEANPSLYALQRQTETLARVLTNAQQEKFFVAPGADGQPRELRLLLSREPAKPRSAPEPPAGDHH